MRAFQYFFLVMVITGALLVLTPYVASEPERAEGDVPKAVAKEQKEQKKTREAEDFWTGNIPALKISFNPEEWENLRKDGRRYAKATLTEGAKAYKDVAVKLKGSAGSFQGPDGKPGITASFEVYKGADRFHGLHKLHFNNGAQDGTFLQEQIAGEMARMAGVPASRCSHALLEWQGRDLGLYVTKEAFTKDFLKFFYKNVDGDLYDGGFVHDLDEKMEKDQGDPADVAALKELIAACGENDNAKRWERLGKVLDADLFAAYCAMEAIVCHWDGYSFNRNNYRLYRDPDSGKFSFFLHGMDQTFADSNFPLMRDFGGQVSSAFMRCPEGQRLYRQKLDTIYENVLKPVDWSGRVTEVGEVVRVALEKRNPQWAKDYANRIGEARSRVTSRIASVAKQLGDLPKPFVFDKDGVAKIEKDWRGEGSGQMEERADEGKPCLYVRSDGAPASWRRTIKLEGGKYRLEGRVRTKGVAAGSGEGAGFRLSGGAPNANPIKGDAPWQAIAFPFETPGGDVILVAELRGKGEAWFEKGSLQLVRVR